MCTLIESIEDKYDGEDGRDYGFIVFMSTSPECKKGMFPPILTLCDYDIEAVGANGINTSRLRHISELDLTDNLISQWSEVLVILNIFPSLNFLNMSNNCLSEDLVLPESNFLKKTLPLRKLVLNGNKINWKSIATLTQPMPHLEELHLSNNCLESPRGEFGHENIRQLYLTCNLIESFEDVHCNLGQNCPNLEVLSLAECPLKNVPNVECAITASVECTGFSRLTTLNVNTTKISSWKDIDEFRTFPKLVELRVKNCPLLDEYTAHERRMLLIARLPNVAILNGGDKIPDNEREDAERAFIRFYLEEEEKPTRYHELVAVHGNLDPLVNVSMKPNTHVKVTISAHQESEVREEIISVKQTVGQFKTQLNQWFHIPIQNMRLYYCDQVMFQVTGPEEMKFPQKALYTYNVRHGDSFIVDEKAPPLPKLKTVSNTNRMSAAYSPNPKLCGTSPAYPQPMRQAVTFAAISPKTFTSANTKGPIKSPKSRNASVKRNLFGETDKSNTEKPSLDSSNFQPFKIWHEDTTRKDDGDVSSSSITNNNVDVENVAETENFKHHSAGN